MRPNPNTRTSQPIHRDLRKAYPSLRGDWEGRRRIRVEAPRRRAWLLSESLDDLVTEGPRTAIAVSRFRRIAGKAGAGAVEGFRSILVDVMSEAVRKQMFGG